MRFCLFQGNDMAIKFFAGGLGQRLFSVALAGCLVVSGAAMADPFDVNGETQNIPDLSDTEFPEGIINSGAAAEMNIQKGNYTLDMVSAGYTNGFNINKISDGSGDGGTLTLTGPKSNIYTTLALVAGTVEMGKGGTEHAFSRVASVAAGSTLKIIGGGGNQINEYLNGLAGTFEMNGYSEALSALNGVASGRVINSGAAQSVLSVGGGTFAGSIGQSDGNKSNIRTVITGGDVYFTGANYYTGGTALNGGMLNLLNVVGGDGANKSDITNLGTGNIDFNGGTLSFNAANGVVMNVPEATTITLGANGGGFRVRNSCAPEIRAKITGGGNLWISYDGGYVTLFNSNNDYTGNTIIGSTTQQWADGNARARLRLGASNVLPDTTTVVFGDARADSTLDMNGKSDTIKAFTGSGVIANNTGTPSVLTLNNSADTVLEARVAYQGQVSLKKAGSNTLTLAGRTNAFSDVFELNSGNLRVYASGAFLPGEKVHVTGDAGLIVETAANWAKGLVANPNNGNNSRLAANPTSFVDNMDAVMNIKYGGSGDSGGIWSDYTTYVFTSTVELTQDTPLQFYKDFDDWVLVTMTPVNADGTLGTTLTMLEHGQWNAVYVSGDVSLNKGIYVMEVRGGQGNGGVGPQTGGIGVGVRTTYSTDTTASSFSALNFDADGNLAFGDGLIRGVDSRSITADFAIDDGKTFTLQGNGSGSIDMLGAVSGDGIFAINAGNTTVTLKGANSHGGGTVLSGKVVAANDLAFGTGEIRLGAGVTDYALTIDATDAAREFNNTVNVATGQSFAVDILGDNGVLFTGGVKGAGTLVFDLDVLNPLAPMYTVDTLDVTGGLTFSILASDPEAIKDTVYTLLEFDNLTGELSLSSLFGSLDTNLWSYGLEGNGIWVAYGTLEAGDVPEPATWLLLMMGLGAICYFRRRKA